MANPFIHALVFLAAVMIPGGLLAYFAWRALSSKKVPNHTAHIPRLDGGDVKHMTRPEVARSAFRDMFPRESLRARGRRARLDRVKAFRHRKYKK